MMMNDLKDYEVSTERNVFSGQYIVRLKEVNGSDVKYVTAANPNKNSNTLDIVKHALKTLEV